MPRSATRAVAGVRSITENACTDRGGRRDTFRLAAPPGASPWWWLVNNSALLLIVVALILVGWWAAT
jgi:hypothetical protein